VKADGLALGKGVTVCDSMSAVESALTSCFEERKHGAAGDVVIVEELLSGREGIGVRDLRWDPRLAAAAGL